MLTFPLYNIVRTLAVLCLVAITWRYWDVSVLGKAFMLAPYVFILALTRRSTYCTAIRVVCRGIAAALVALIAVLLLLDTGSDPQSPIGIGYAVVIQYGVLFVSEAIIGLVTYQEPDTE